MKLNSPLWHHHATFDAEAIIYRHGVYTAPMPGYATNYLGVRIDPKFLPHILTPCAGQVEYPPVPANWHADMAEWAAALRAVELAQGKFTMMELGCGWGCWMNITGRAARNMGIPFHLIGVEADEGHLQFARESMATNEFRADQFTLIRGIASAESGLALFPRQAEAGSHWGLAPIFGATVEQQQEAEATGSHEILPMIALAEAAAGHDRIDLLHIDIQGGEADLVEGCLDVLNEKFASLLIGSHSREIEGRLFDMLLRAGWALEVERPAILGLSPNGPQVTIDGVQFWRNPALAA